ncbi:MAG: DUF721 domain-containing protein [Alphaproteobacteria bacterium]
MRETPKAGKPNTGKAKPLRPAADQPVQRAGAPRAVAASVARVTGPILRGRGFAEARVIADWPLIVGAQLAEDCCPEKLTHGRGENAIGVLHLRVAPAAAVEIQHLTPQIVERVNRFFGFRAVDRLALVQGPLPKRQAATRKPPRALSPAEDDGIAQRTALIEDEALRRAVADLGRAILRRTQK